MNELTIANKTDVTKTINKMSKIITTIGVKSKELCITMYDMFKTTEPNDRAELTKYTMEKLELSKSSITQMKKAGEMYHLYPELDNMSHTKIVEIAPINETDYTLQEFSDYAQNTINSDVTELCNFTQEKLRKSMKTFLEDSVDEDSENDIEDNNNEDSENDSKENILKMWFRDFIDNLYNQETKAIFEEDIENLEKIYNII